MTTRLGVTFASLSSLGIPAAIDIAQTAADLGYQQFWTAEATASESFALLGAVGASVPGLGALATGIIPIQVRTPTIACGSGACAESETKA